MPENAYSYLNVLACFDENGQIVVDKEQLKAMNRLHSMYTDLQGPAHAMYNYDCTHA